MPAASLPIVTAPAQPITVTYVPAQGVRITFGANETNNYIVAPFRGQMHWVRAGQTHAVLPAFQPTTDSLILEPVSIGINQPICQPFPKFFTFENVSKTSVLQEIVTFRQFAPLNKFSLPEIDRFFDGAGDIGISLKTAVGTTDVVIHIDEKFYRKGDDIKIDNERMTVISANGNFHAVTRAARGTVAAAHATGASVLFAKPFAVPVDDAGVKLGKGAAQDGATGFIVRVWDKHPVRCPTGRELIYTHVYLHHLRFCELAIPAQNALYDALPYGLTGSVGTAGDNDQNDVLMVKHRLRDLGFSVRPTPAFPAMTIDSTADAILGDIIGLFRNIIDGEESIGAGKELIDRRSAAEEWLWAHNAPQWQKLETDISRGYENTDRYVRQNNIPLNPNITGTLTAPSGNVYTQDGNDDEFEHDWGTNYLVSVIKDAGANYLANDDDLTENCRLNQLVIRTNDASHRGGGPTTDHLGHETGLLVDIRLANRDGYSPGGILVQNTGNAFTAYYQDYTYLVIRSLLTVNATRWILIKKTLTTDFAGEPRVLNAADHNHHVHLQIRPPAAASPWDADLANHI